MPPFTVTPSRMQVPSTSTPPAIREPEAGVPPLGQLTWSANAAADKATGLVMPRSWAQAASATDASTAHTMWRFMSRPPRVSEVVNESANADHATALPCCETETTAKAFVRHHPSPGENGATG